MKANEYQIFADGVPLPMHVSKDLEELKKRATLHHKIFGRHYEIRNIYGLVWSTKEAEE